MVKWTLFALTEVRLTSKEHGRLEICSLVQPRSDSAQTARLYKAMLNNSTLNFIPTSPVFMFHSRDDQTVPFVNAQMAERYYKQQCDVHYDFDHYGEHGIAFLKFIIKVSADL